MTSKLIVITRKQETILRSILAGKLNKQIAPEVNLSRNGLQSQIAKIFNMLGVHDRIELFALFGFHELKVIYKRNPDAPKIKVVENGYIRQR